MLQEVVFCRGADIVVGSIIVKPIGINKTVELKVIRKELDEDGFVHVGYEDKSIDKYNFYKSEVVVKKRNKGENVGNK